MLKPESRKHRAAARWAGLALLLAGIPVGAWQLNAVAAGNTPQNCGNCQGNSGSGAGNGGGTDGGSPGKALKASSVSVDPIAPGVSGWVTVKVENPNNQAVNVTRVTGTVTDVTPALRNTSLGACDKQWIVLEEFTGTQRIPKNGSANVRMPVSFDNLNLNQDNCKNVTYSFSFTVYGQQA